MDVREKLVEIVCDAMESDGCIGHCNHSPCFEVERVVNALIDNGVTVQEWISVKEMLPQEDGAYLVTTHDFGNRQCVKFRWFAKDGETVDKYDLAGQKYVWYFYDSECGYASTKSVTHWMPMPQPPKGE